MDIRLTIDLGATVNYMCKYVTKTEKLKTSTVQKFFESEIRRINNDERTANNTDSEKMAVVLSRIMNRAHGTRMRSRQETCHLLNGRPLVYCSHKDACGCIFRKKQCIKLDESPRLLPVCRWLLSNLCNDVQGDKEGSPCKQDSKTERTGSGLIQSQVFK